MYLEQALHGFTEVWSRHGIATVAVQRDEVPTAGFWRAPGPGLERRWITDPAMVPDIRRQGNDWTLADSTLVSIGFVYRDELPVPAGRDDRRYRAIAENVADRGVRVLRTHRLTTQTHRYAHRLPEHVVAQPYVANLDMGDLHEDDGLLAIGQSRHLGGGLLVPFDIPRGMEDRLWGSSR